MRQNEEKAECLENTAEEDLRKNICDVQREHDVRSSQIRLRKFEVEAEHGKLAHRQQHLHNLSNAKDPTERRFNLLRRFEDFKARKEIEKESKELAEQTETKKLDPSADGMGWENSKSSC